MTLKPRLISAGFAVAALASASVPAVAITVWPDVDFEEYANAGKPVAAASVEAAPAPRPGYIWSPGHYERASGDGQVWVQGQWIRHDDADQVALYSAPGSIAADPMTLRDRGGNVLPTNPDADPAGSSATAIPAEASTPDSSRR